MKKKYLLIIAGLLLAGCSTSDNISNSTGVLSDSASFTSSDPDSTNTLSSSSADNIEPGRLVGKYPTIPGVPAQRIIDGVTYDFAWADEFNGTTLNEDYWSYEVMAGGGNEELQFYTRENGEVADGMFNITAKVEKYQNRDYTSARIRSFDKIYFKYGYVEASIALPSFMGSWPAFWMLGQSHKSIGWPNCGEIDIIESINEENTVHGTLHYGKVDTDTKIGTLNLASKTEFHTYGMVWNEKEIVVYMDGEIWGRVYIEDEKYAAFHEEFYFILNLAVGGKWPQFVIDHDKLPSTMQVDYVRLYQI